jgi:hypothetical protein
MYLTSKNNLRTLISTIDLRSRSARFWWIFVHTLHTRKSMRSHCKVRMNFSLHFTYSQKHEVALQGPDESWPTLYILAKAWGRIARSGCILTHTLHTRTRVKSQCKAQMYVGPHFTYSKKHEVALQGPDESWPQFTYTQKHEIAV